jgi:hypothetical protein
VTSGCVIVILPVKVVSRIRNCLATFVGFNDLRDPGYGAREHSVFETGVGSISLQGRIGMGMESANQFSIKAGRGR